MSSNLHVKETGERKSWYDFIHSLEPPSQVQFSVQTQTALQHDLLLNGRYNYLITISFSLISNINWCNHRCPSINTSSCACSYHQEHWPFSLLLLFTFISLLTNVGDVGFPMAWQPWASEEAIAALQMAVVSAWTCSWGMKEMTHRAWRGDGSWCRLPRPCCHMN